MNPEPQNIDPFSTQATGQTAAILGASNKHDRYSYKAFKALSEAGWEVLPIHPSIPSIEGNRVYRSLKDLTTKPHTVTVYVNPSILEPIIDDLIELNPARVIFNPGTESAMAKERLKNSGIEALEACTLVLLATHQF